MHSKGFSKIMEYASLQLASKNQNKNFLSFLKA